MENIPLIAIPNQSFQFRGDSNVYNIAIKATKGIMSCDITRDGTVLELGARMVAGTPLLPYAYQEIGNFILLTMNNEYPDYTQFGVTQFLIYITQAEVEAFNAGT